MEIIIPLILIVGGLVAIFYIRPKAKSAVTEIKYMKTKTINELKDMFSQMDENGLGDDYREFVELKGNVIAENLVETPFSNRKVAFCESRLAQVVETRESYRDSDGHMRTQVVKHENTISDEKTSQDISMIDNSSNEPVILEIAGTGCKLDIPKTFDRFEAETLGFKMTEKTIEDNQNLYVIGEAFRVGNKIHIGKPMDNKKPFIVTTKSEEDLVNSSNKNAMIALIGGIIAIVVGIFMFINM